MSDFRKVSGVELLDLAGIGLGQDYDFEMEMQAKAIEEQKGIDAKKTYEAVYASAMAQAAATVAAGKAQAAGKSKTEQAKAAKKAKKQVAEAAIKDIPVKTAGAGALGMSTNTWMLIGGGIFGLGLLSMVWGKKS